MMFFRKYSFLLLDDAPKTHASPARTVFIDAAMIRQSSRFSATIALKFSGKTTELSPISSETIFTL
jgi:hypothetical protein